MQSSTRDVVNDLLKHESTFRTDTGPVGVARREEQRRPLRCRPRPTSIS